VFLELRIERMFDTVINMQEGREMEEVSAIDMLTHALKLLAADYLPGMGSADLGSRCIALTKARQQFDGVVATSIAEADRAGVAANAGTRTMAQYVSARTHCAPVTVRADERVGRWASGLPSIDEAMLDGRLSREHCDHLRKLENPRVAEAMRRDQHLFVEWACDLEWKSFENACAYWLKVNDQDGAEPEDEASQNVFTARRQADGRVKGSFDLDPITGEIVMQQISAEESALFTEDEEHGFPRTVGQRRAQAFANLVRRGAGRTTNSAKPLIHVVMSLKILENAIAQLAKDPSEQDFTSMLDPTDPDGRCELVDGTPIHPKYALVLMMQARVRRQVLGAKDVTLNASYETRQFPDWMHYIRLVETRGQCAVAGCDAHHSWLHRDHVQPRSKLGPTALANLELLCGPDNRFKSDGDQLPGRD
jgi:hypothetical protein